MKNPVPTPVVIGGIVVVLALVAFFFMKNVTAEPHTPRPDPAMFRSGKTVQSPSPAK